MVQECIECGNSWEVEEHHIVFRSQQGAMINCPLNKIPLCPVCHKGDNGPHMKKNTDLKYKQQLQERLQYLLSHKECYTEEEVKSIFMIKKKEAFKLLKSLPLKVEGDVVGYHREDIIKQAMGGRFYA